jgi:hypothetical protein
MKRSWPVKWNRKSIEKNGLYENIPMDDYHGNLCVGPSVSSSGLRTIFSKSPAHYFATSYLNPNPAAEPESKSFLLGRASHHLLLGQDDFSTLFVVRPEELAGKPWHGNRNDCRAWIAKHQEEGRTVLTATQIEQIRGMARSLASHPLIKHGMLNGKVEQSLVWRDKKTGVWLKSRPDAIPTDSGDGADLKGTSEVGFGLDDGIFKYFRYDMQAALFKWGLKEVLGVDMASFAFVLVEWDPPHCVDVIALAPDQIAEAEADLRIAVDTFAYCVKTGDWFGPSGSQNDARWASKSDFTRKNNEFRRDFLKREIERT